MQLGPNNPKLQAIAADPAGHRAGRGATWVSEHRSDRCPAADRALRHSGPAAGALRGAATGRRARTPRGRPHQRSAAGQSPHRTGLIPECVHHRRLTRQVEKSILIEEAKKWRNTAKSAPPSSLSLRSQQPDSPASRQRLPRSAKATMLSSKPCLSAASSTNQFLVANFRSPTPSTHTVDASSPAATATPATPTSSCSPPPCL